MKNVMTYNGYMGTVEYTEEDGILFGHLVGINDIISYEGESIKELRKAFQDAVDDYLEFCKSIGKIPHHPYSGKFTIRLDPKIHAQLAAQAQAAGKSLNQYVTEVLSQI